MKFVRSVSVLALSAIAFTACEEGVTDVEISDLAGFWNATQFEYADVSGDTVCPGELEIDAIATGGGTLTLDVADGGSFTGSINIPNLTPGPLDIGGTISLLSQEELHIDFNDQTEGYGLFGDFDADFTLVDDVLTFVNEETTFDFPDALEEQACGTDAVRGPVAASLTASFER